MQIKQGQLVYLSALLILLVFYFCHIGLVRYSADMTMFPISHLKCSETSTSVSRGCVTLSCSKETNFCDSFLYNLLEIILLYSASTTDSVNWKNGAFSRAKRFGLK